MARASILDDPRTLADLLAELGGIAPRRVLLTPPPGKATEKDLIRLNDRKRRRYELVNGVLVEKAMGLTESFVAMWLGHLLQRFLDEHDLGFLTGEAGAMRLMPGLVRIPDISFISWDRVPVRGQVPDVTIPDFAPDLAVEVLSEGSTREEMERKLKEYFLAGVRLVWFVDPDRRTVEVFTAPDNARLLTAEQVLDGGEVLPGLSLAVREIFARMPPQATGRAPARKKSGPGGKRPKKGGPR
jgi:Uma2 family endonuclease